MPIHKVSGGWRWGNHGKIYPNQEGAEKQAAAAHANGFTGDELKAAGVALRAPSDRVLFLRRSDKGDHPGEWCFPGGRLEQGETTRAAAIREVLEETGHNVKDPREADLRDGFATFGEDVEEEFTPTLNEEHTAFAWAMPWDAPGPLHPGVAATLELVPQTTRTHDASMLDFAGYYAPEKIGRTRKITPEGFLILEGTPIARLGEQLYNAEEINRDGEGNPILPDDPRYIPPDPHGCIRVKRLPEEVFHPETLASFEGKDYVIEHPPDGVNLDNWKNQTVGHVQNVRRGEGAEDDLVIADIVVKDPGAIEHVNKNLPENSAGYRADYERAEPGWAIQRNIIGNHVAAVRAGRAGARVAVRDHESTSIGDNVMATVKKAPSRVMSAVRTALAVVGVKSDDAARVESAMSLLTADAESESESEESGGEYTMKDMARDMKSVKDWIAARDAEAEAKKAEEKREADRKAHDAEEGKKRSEEAAAEMAGHEAVGDTIVEAEGAGGGYVTMGKTWTGSMTGDGAPEPVLSAVNSRAEILVPGVPKLTADAIKGNGGKVLAQYMRDALLHHAATPAGRLNVANFAITSDSIPKLSGRELIGVFNGVSGLARHKNNLLARTAASRTTADGRPTPQTIADLNEANRKFWAAPENSGPHGRL